MKLQFKFSLFNIITFLILSGIFYWLVPLPSNTGWRAVICLGAVAVIFGMCFVVVTQKGPIRKSK